MFLFQHGQLWMKILKFERFVLGKDHLCWVLEKGFFSRFYPEYERNRSQTNKMQLLSMQRRCTDTRLVDIEGTQRSSWSFREEEGVRRIPQPE